MTEIAIEPHRNTHVYKCFAQAPENKFNDATSALHYGLSPFAY